jgi:hypothetical protein
LGESLWNIFNNKIKPLLIFFHSKQGYGFQQDAKKLSFSFSLFGHKFYEFTDHVINIDEIATEVIVKYN